MWLRCLLRGMFLRLDFAFSPYVLRRSRFKLSLFFSCGDFVELIVRSQDLDDWRCRVGVDAFYSLHYVAGHGEDAFAAWGVFAH